MHYIICVAPGCPACKGEGLLFEIMANMTNTAQSEVGKKISGHLKSRRLSLRRLAELTGIECRELRAVIEEDGIISAEVLEKVILQLNLSGPLADDLRASYCRLFQPESGSFLLKDLAGFESKPDTPADVPEVIAPCLCQKNGIEVIRPHLPGSGKNGMLCDKERRSSGRGLNTAAGNMLPVIQFNDLVKYRRGSSFPGFVARHSVGTAQWKVQGGTPAILCCSCNDLKLAMPGYVFLVIDHKTPGSSPERELRFDLRGRLSLWECVNGTWQLDELSKTFEQECSAVWTFAVLDMIIKPYSFKKGAL